MSGLEVKAFYKQEMQPFARSPAKLPWRPRGAGEGFGLSELKPVLTDTVRTRFVAPRGFGESTYKNILNSHCFSGAISELGKNLDVNADCLLVSSPWIFFILPPSWLWAAQPRLWNMKMRIHNTNAFNFPFLQRELNQRKFDVPL